MKQIIVRLDVMLALRKMRSKELAERIDITEANLSLLRTGKVKGVRFDTLAKLCEALDCTPGDLLDIADIEDVDSAGAQAQNGQSSTGD